MCAVSHPIGPLCRLVGKVDRSANGQSVYNTVDWSGSRLIGFSKIDSTARYSTFAACWLVLQYRTVSLLPCICMCVSCERLLCMCVCVCFVFLIYIYIVFFCLPVRFILCRLPFECVHPGSLRVGLVNRFFRKNPIACLSSYANVSCFQLKQPSLSGNTKPGNWVF